MSGKYYPHNWDVIKDCPEEYFEPMTWEEFLVMKVSAWELPGSVECIIRAEHVETGEITEHVYQRVKPAQQRIINYMRDGMHELTVCNSDSIHLLKINHEDEPDNA